VIRKTLLYLLVTGSIFSQQKIAPEKEASLKADLAGQIEGMKKQAQVMVDSVFSFGELGFQEFETSKYLTGILEKEGFRIERGIAGKIVNISSDAGRVGSTGETVYAAAKGGLIAFTKSLAREMARYRINVNCVCPGPTDTPLFSAQPERMREALTRAIPFRRIAQPEEIAEAVMFFLGRRSDYITGQALSVSGGLTMVD